MKRGGGANEKAQNKAAAVRRDDRPAQDPQLPRRRLQRARDGHRRGHRGVRERPCERPARQVHAVRHDVHPALLRLRADRAGALRARGRGHGLLDSPGRDARHPARPLRRPLGRAHRHEGRPRRAAHLCAAVHRGHHLQQQPRRGVRRQEYLHQLHRHLRVRLQRLLHHRLLLRELRGRERAHQRHRLRHERGPAQALHPHRPRRERALQLL